MAHLLAFSKTRAGIFLVLLLFPLGLFAQIGGPYTTDANTMLLLHFDGDLVNESTFSANGEYNGDASNFFFLTNPVTGMNQCLRIDNDSQADSAYITVADTQYLDLVGDWTIEGWINIFTFGTGSSDWRWVPRLVIKTGSETFWRPNYFVEMWGDQRMFSCGYQAASQDQWPQSNSATNIMEVGKWYHMAFIRDTNTHLLMTIIHRFNDTTNDIELVSFTAADYLGFGAADPTPIVTNQPVHIGYAGGGGDSFLDGFVDEVRISNVVRQFPVPPVIADVSIVSNQTTSVPEYPVGADIIPMFGATLARAELMYSLDGGTNWTPVTMTTVSGDSMVGVIPQQPLGSVVLYYLEAEDNNGRVFQYPQNAGWQNAEYYSFGVYSPNTQTLDMDFEEGSGTPVDNSGYANPVTVFGSPSHETDAAAGTYSLYLEGDSSLLEIDAPFLAAKEFLVDVWVKPDPRLATTDFQYCRFLNRPRNAASWADNNYQLRFNPGGVLYAGTDGSYTITMDDSMQMDTWNHIMLEVRDAPAGDTVAHYAVLRWADANDNIIQQKYVGFDADIVEGFAPLRIGKAAGTDPVPGAYPPFYKGYYDNIKIYNYPAANLPLQNLTNIDGKENNLLYSYELSQNYPNPFNPVTDIKFSLAKTGKVQLVVYDILGRKVKTLINSTMTFGKHSTQWNGTDEFGNRVSSGIYFYRLDTKEFKQTKKMILMK